MAVLDSYPESNYGTDLNLYASWHNAHGQTVVLGGDFTVTHAKFYAKKSGSPADTVRAEIYATTGTHGTNAVPTGSALAVSDTITAVDLPSSYELVTFTFSGENIITLSAGTCYAIVIYYASGTSSNKIMVGCDISSPTHSGNGVRFYSSWGAMSYDVIFYAILDGIYTGDSIEAEEDIDVNVLAYGESYVKEYTVIEENTTVIMSELVVDIAENINVVDSISNLYIEKITFITVNDSVSVSEEISTLVFADIFFSVYDSIVCSELKSARYYFPINTSTLPVLYSPVMELEASAYVGAVLDAKCGVSTCFSLSGSIVDEKSPTVQMSCTMSSPELMFTSEYPNNTPLFTLSSNAGGLVVGKSPGYVVEGESYSNYIGLESNTPSIFSEAFLFEKFDFAMEAKVPRCFLTAEMFSGSIHMSGKIPCAYMSSDVFFTLLSLDSISPHFKVNYNDMLLEDLSLSMEGFIPLFTTSGSTGYSSGEPSILVYADRFEDYTLEFVR